MTFLLKKIRRAPEAFCCAEVLVARDPLTLPSLAFDLDEDFRMFADLLYGLAEAVQVCAGCLSEITHRSDRRGPRLFLLSHQAQREIGWADLERRSPESVPR